MSHSDDCALLLLLHRLSAEETTSITHTRFAGDRNWRLPSSAPLYSLCLQRHKTPCSKPNRSESRPERNPARPDLCRVPQARGLGCARASRRALSEPRSKLRAFSSRYRNCTLSNRCRFRALPLPRGDATRMRLGCFAGSERLGCDSNVSLLRPPRPGSR